MRLVLVASVVVLSFTGKSQGQEATEGEKLFALKVKSVLTEKCLACHGADPEDIQGGLDLRTRESTLVGGDSFGDQVLVAGEGTKSWLYRVTLREEDGYEMPPKEADRLSQEQAWAIRDWIDAGAPWPSDEQVESIRNTYGNGVTVATSGGLSDDWTNRRYKPEDLWAYHPIAKTDVPVNAHPIDWFIEKRLSEAGLRPAPDSPPTQLARRISFGLTGLPPTFKDVQSFAKEYRIDATRAVESYTQSLMNSPHYGEHFARHWLDVVRYADSAGFANDYSRPNAWRYRDYVVRSFNEDLPFDQFVQQQIAGDELDNSSPEMLVATGFLRMGPWEQTGMSVFKVTRQQWLDDVTDSVGQTFLAHPLQCAKCHDHKFDPIPTRDYYRVMAVFSTTQFAERKAKFIPSESLERFRESNQWANAKIAAYQEQQKSLNDLMKQLRKKETTEAKVGDNGLSPGDEASLARINKNIARHKLERLKTSPLAFSVYTGATNEQQKNYKAPKAVPQNVWLGREVPKDTILTGGDVYSTGEVVTPGALSAAQELGNMQALAFPDDRGKRRLALAQWITQKDNPLTARVIVNRVWAWHFGKGIANNPNNFGATGTPPSHPALLDYLATWFVENGWSIKKLNQLIVSSRTYRRSTIHPNNKVLVEADPKGKLYATFSSRRLTAEEIRDAMLFASGELNPAVGGIPCRPEINLEVANQPRQIMGGTASVYEPDATPMQRNRRTIYAEKIRGLRDPFMETFNQPGPDKSCELRESSTVAPQALTMLNSEAIRNRSIAFADRLVKSGLSGKELIRRAFEVALARSPSDEELRACIAHWDASTKHEQTLTYEPPTVAVEIQRTVMAEKTGEPYDFTEVRPVYRDYQFDLHPSEVNAHTRGLARVCLVIFNLNEFSYLD